MLNRKKRQFLNDILLKPSTLSFFTLLIIIAISIPLFKNISKQYEINKEISSLQKEIEDFEGKNSELKKTFEYLESDQFASEQARKNLNYKKEGEEVVVIKTIEDNKNITPEEKYTKSYENSSKPSNPILWWRYFFY